MAPRRLKSVPNDPEAEGPVEEGFEGNRLIKVNAGFLNGWGARTLEGQLVRLAEWGEPDEDGVYTPTFQFVDDGVVAVNRELLVRTEAERLAYKELTERMRDYFNVHANDALKSFTLVEATRLERKEKELLGPTGEPVN